MSGNRKQEHWWKNQKKKLNHFIFKMCVRILIFWFLFYLVNVYLVIIFDNLFDRSRFVLVTIARLMMATLKHVPWLNRIKMDNFSSRLCTLRLLLVWGFRLRRPGPTFDHRDRGVRKRRRKTMKRMTCTMFSLFFKRIVLPHFFLSNLTSVNAEVSIRFRI